MMLIIFQPNINNNLARLFLFLLVLVVLAESDSPNCTQLHFATPFTKCEILFDQCPATSPADSPPPLAFRSCQMQKCSRLGVSDVCKSSVPIELDEPSCYRYCCKSSAFSAEVCLHNNEIIQNNTESMNSYLFAILIACAAGIIVVVACFFVNELKCFEKKKPLVAHPQAPIWKPARYEDHKCNICEQYGAILETACKHYFHIACFREAVGTAQIKGQCPGCTEMSRRYRLWCSECHQKYIKIGFSDLKTMAQIELFYSESKGLHLDCLKDLDCYAKTDLRLTSSTND